MVEVVDSVSTWRIDKIEGHKSDEDGQKKVKNERQGLFQIRNGKYFG